MHSLTARWPQETKHNTTQRRGLHRHVSFEYNALNLDERNLVSIQYQYWYQYYDQYLTWPAHRYWIVFVIYNEQKSS